MNKSISDPSIFLMLGFGTGLAVLGVAQLMPTNTDLLGAATFATLVAAIAEIGTGIFAFARGDTYIGTIGMTFGAWLAGYYFLVTLGVSAGIYTPLSAGLYCFGLIIPTILLAIPAVRLKLVAFTGVFVFLTLALLFLGLAGMPIGGSATWARLGGVSLIITAALLWYSALGAIKGLAAQMAAGPPAN